jgi:excisionase family DNA binding protein
MSAVDVVSVTPPHAKSESTNAVDSATHASSRDVITIDETAEILHCSPAHVYRLCQQGRLPAVRLGRAWRLSRQRVLQIVQSPEIVR